MNRIAADPTAIHLLAKIRASGALNEYLRFGISRRHSMYRLEDRSIVAAMGRDWTAVDKISVFQLHAPKGKWCQKFYQLGGGERCSEPPEPINKPSLANPPIS